MIESDEAIDKYLIKSVEEIMSDRFESLASGEVVSVQHETQVLGGHRTFRSGELNDAIKSYVASAIAGWSEEKNDWFTTRGIECEALRFGAPNWQKGRIRLSLEFCPDEELPVLSASHNSIPTTAPAPTVDIGSPLTSTAPPTSDVPSSHEILAVEQEHQPVAATATAQDIPIIAVVGMAATAVTMASPPQIELEPAMANSIIPHLSDTVLELEHYGSESTSRHSVVPDELLVIFPTENDRGHIVPSGEMVMDLADGLDFSEHDLLSFEANGMSDAAEGFGSFQDIDKPENSGMLNDEVWTEIDRTHWPRVN